MLWNMLCTSSKELECTTAAARREDEQNILFSCRILQSESRKNYVNWLQRDNVKTMLPYVHFLNCRDVAWHCMCTSLNMTNDGLEVGIPFLVRERVHREVLLPSNINMDLRSSEWAGLRQRHTYTLTWGLVLRLETPWRSIVRKLTSWMFPEVPWLVSWPLRSLFREFKFWDSNLFNDVRL